MIRLTSNWLLLYKPDIESRCMFVESCSILKTRRTCLFIKCCLVVAGLYRIVHLCKKDHHSVTHLMVFHGEHRLYLDSSA